MPINAIRARIQRKKQESIAIGEAVFSKLLKENSYLNHTLVATSTSVALLYASEKDDILEPA